MIRFTKLLIRLLVFALLLLGAMAWGLARLTTPPRSSPMREPTIEQVQALAQLALLEVQVSEVLVSELAGYSGSTSLILVVHGQARIGSDLRQASFVELDHQRRHVVLVLPSPQVVSAALDQERTSVYTLTRHGLWQLLPMAAGEPQVIDQAMRAAQRRVREAADRPALRRQAMQHATRLIEQALVPLDWSVQLEWRDSE